MPPRSVSTSDPGPGDVARCHDDRPDLPEQEATTRCQRTDHQRTVLVIGIGNGSTGRQQMLALTAAAWTAVGGS